MKAEEILIKIEELIEDDIIKIISRKIILDLNKTNYFRHKGTGNTNKSPNEAVCGGIIYIACIKAGNPKSIETVCDLMPTYSHYTRKEINKEIKHIKKALRMKYCKKQTMMGTSCIVLTTPENYFLELCKKENASKNVIKAGKEIYENLKDNLEDNLQSCNPVYIGGTIFYIACILNDMKVTQRSVADKINATEVTIRNIYHKILAIDKELTHKLKYIEIKKKLNSIENKKKKESEKLGY